MKGSERYLAPVLMALATASGCKETVVIGYNEDQMEPDAGIDADAGNEDADTGVQSELLTRGQMVRDLVYDVMGYDGNCTETFFSDVPPTGEVCRSLEVLKKMNFIEVPPNGLFRPDDGVNRAELFKSVSLAMGLVPFKAECLNNVPDVDQNSWYAPYLGALCENNYPIADEDGFAKPEEPVTMETWTNYLTEMNGTLQGPATRGQVARLMTKIVRDASTGGPCTTQFSDVPNGTSLCQVVKYVNDNGIINGYSGGAGDQFGPNDLVTYAQMAKIDLLATGVPLVTESNGCSGANPSDWYAAYMDSLCAEGLIDGTWASKAPLDVPSRVAYKLAWDSDIWRTKNVNQ
jgi:hypothetical protein